MRNSQQLIGLQGKTVKAVLSLASDLHPLNDDTNGFVLEFTDGTRVTVGAMADAGIGVVGVNIEASDADRHRAAPQP